MLSYGEKLILSKHVLQSLPVYIMSAMRPPKGVLNVMKKYFANFLWGVSEGKNKYHWASWKKLCLPKDEGGIDKRKMEEIANSHTVIRWWRLRTHPSL